MTGRKRSAADDEDGIPEDLFATIPEMDGGKPARTIGQEMGGFVPLHIETVEDGYPPPTGAHSAPRGGPMDVHSILSEVRRQMEATFANELSRAEDSFNGVVHTMEDRMRELIEENARLREHNEQLQKVKQKLATQITALKDIAESLQ